MKITVWGGSGFLGSHVSDALSNAGHEVIVADKQKSDYLRSDQKMFVGNILDESDISVHTVSTLSEGARRIVDSIGGDN